MSATDDTFPANVQQSVISASLNSGMLLNFLMGMYTMVFTGAMHSYISKMPASTSRRIILSTTSLLYLLSMGQFIIQWYYLNLAIVIDGDTRESIFGSTLEGGPVSLYAFFQFLVYSVFIVSDGLMIWRCYHVWAMSIRVVFVPLVLLFAESGLLVAVTVIAALDNSLASDSAVVDETGIIITLVFASLATTIITTSLIAYKIHSSSRLTGAIPKARGRFIHVVIVITESAAVYAFANLVFAIYVALPSGTDVGSPLSNSGYYLGTFVVAIAGMAPTVLVARIAISSQNNTVVHTVTHLSGLQFKSKQEGGHGGSRSGTEVFNYSNQYRDEAQQDEEKRIQ